MKKFFTTIILGLSIIISVYAEDSTNIKPMFTYLSNVPVLEGGEAVTGPSRILTLHGRKGINPTSIHTNIRLGKHTLNRPKGTVTLWFFSLEDLATSFAADHMALNNPDYGSYPFLSDCAVQRDYANSNFFFGWFRSDELRAQFFKGTIHPVTGFEPPQKAWVQAVPFKYFVKHRWYQLAFSWDTEKKEMRLYVNGILVGTSDRFNEDFYRDKVADTLYSGAPALCQGEISFYDRVLDENEIYASYHRGATDFDPSTEQLLKHVFSGAGLKEFSFRPDNNWVSKMNIDFRDSASISNFYIQGEQGAVKPGKHPEGLLVETPAVSFEKKNRDRQVYLWTNQVFEGNLYVEFEWKSLQDHGLSLIMVNASGMARERFMQDYPKRTSGQMWMVYGEDVRSYHWEFFRNMNDVRNDVGTAFSRKNPFQFRQGFGSYSKPFAIDTWHKSQLLIREGHLVAAIDGQILLDIRDDSKTNTGCILNFGNIALRVMLNSKLVFRNLKVFNEKLPFNEEPFAAASADPNFHLYMLAGQSNMAGRGIVDSLSHPADPRILMLDKDGQWISAADPLHFDKKEAGVGPGLAFAQQMLKGNPDKNIRIGLMPCAVGGTSITKWQPGAVDEKTKTHPYDDAIARVKTAMKSGKLKGILWHQGESNVKDADYNERLTELIGRFRTAFKIPDLPVVVGELGYFNEERIAFNKRLQSLAFVLKHARLASAKGLSRTKDNIHFETSSARELGVRFADAMKALQASIE
jgi:hypothetical protein